jgi:shikimate kinase
MNKSQSSDAPIFIVGFMGAGKTTVGQVLAKELGYDFIDLDNAIALQTGKSVQQIFLELGEAEFRWLETEAIRSCRNLVSSVVALGGGAYVSQENRDLLRGIGKTIWLDCPLDVCLQRIRDNKSRPLLGDEEAMRTLLDKRIDSYSQADYVVNSDELSPEQLANEIVRLLRE